MIMHNRFDYFLKVAKEGKALKRTPRQVYEHYKYEGLRKFLPKDKKLRKKGHILGVVNDLLEAINTVYGTKPFIDFHTELAKLYSMFLVDTAYLQKQKTGAEPQIDTPTNILPETAFTSYEQKTVSQNVPLEDIKKHTVDLPANNAKPIMAEEPAQKTAHTGKRNQVFTPAKIDPNRLEQIRSTVKEYVDANTPIIDEAILQYQTIKVDESKYTEKVDPEIAKLLGLNEDGEIV
jgi:hypothetical protein